MNYLLALMLPVLALSKTEVDETRASIAALIRPLMASSKAPVTEGELRFDTCEKHKIDWPALVFRQRPTVIEFTFREGCDIQGKITPQIFRPFLIDLKLKGLERFDRIQATGTMSAELEARAILKLQLREGLLTGKNARARFESDYSVRPNIGENGTQMENLGGELRISEINGKMISLKEKILVR